MSTYPETMLNSSPPKCRQARRNHVRRLSIFTLQSIAFIPVLLVVQMLSGCASEQGFIPPPLAIEKREAVAGTVQAQAAAVQPFATAVEQTPKPPLPSRSVAGKGAPSSSVLEEKADITLSFDQIPLPSFVQVVYGSILKWNFSVDPQVFGRTDLVTLRTGQAQTPTEVAETARMLLKSYGVAVTDMGGGFYRIVPDSALKGYAPEIRRGRALPEVPLPLRPIFQLVELEAVRSGDVSQHLRTMFGQRITVQEDATRNALMISGQSDDVTAALEAVHVLDQPLMKGRNSVRINPVLWPAEELARRLNEILTTEGYGVGTSANLNVPVILLPIQAVNAIIVFAHDQAVIDHVVKWAKDLDRPIASRGAGSNYFTYHVRYTDAQELSKTLQELLSGAPVSTQAAIPAGAVVVGPTPTPRRSSRVVVNPATNSLIFQGNADEYTQLLGLMRELDKPAKAALIEVTVAEVSLDDKHQLGIEWAFGDAAAGGLSGGTVGGLGIGSGGLTIKRLNSALDVRMVLNALATNNRAKILSSPRIVARNGETATIQVGDEVPIITSQQTTPTTAGTGGILQTVQYRNTGVILRVRPTIHSGDRIDMDVAQEVSSASSTTTGVSSSPTISSKKVETKLSLKDGSTVMLGGLISIDESQNESGVPLLKDIPGIGQLFRTNSDTNRKRELIVLITPYVINDDYDAQSITEAFRKQLGPWAQSGVQPLRPPRGKGEETRTSPDGARLGEATGPLAEATPNQEVVLSEGKNPGTVQLEPSLQLKSPPAIIVPVGRPVTDPNALAEIRAAMERERSGAVKKPAKKTK